MDALAADKPLSAEDPYAKVLSAWRGELEHWEARFAAWDGDAALVHPPRVPTVARCGRTQDKALASQRKAAYDKDDGMRKNAHARWAAKNMARKKEGKKQSRSRPDDDGSQATKRRQQSQQLRTRHAAREAERRRSAEPEATAEEASTAAAWLNQGSGEQRPRGMTQKALEAAHANLQKATIANVVSGLIGQLEEDERDAAASERGRAEDAAIQADAAERRAWEQQSLTFAAMRRSCLVPKTSCTTERTDRGSKRRCSRS